MISHILTRLREAADLGLPVTLTRPEAAAVAVELARLEALTKHPRDRSLGRHRHPRPQSDRVRGVSIEAA